MPGLLINNDVFKSQVIKIYNEEKQRRELIAKWKQLNESEQQFVIHYLTFVSPKFQKKLMEQDEKNSSFLTKAQDVGQFGLDILGIFDPTGIADAVNALWYFGRGEYLFGMLSLVSVIPYIGDALAKPVLLLGKTSLKAIKPIIATKNPAKIAQGVTKLGQTKSGKYLYDFFYNFESKIAPKLVASLTELEKNKIVGKLAKTAKSWVNIFTDASKQIKVPTKSLGLGSKGLGGTLLKDADKIDFVKTLDMVLSPNKGAINAFRKAGSKPSWFKLGPLEFKKIWKVPQLRKTIGKTKSYLRLLDYFGIANFIGPEELIQKVGEKEAEEAFVKFSQSPDGKEMYENEIFTEIPDTTLNKQTEKEPTPSEPDRKQKDAFSTLIDLTKILM